MHMHVGARLGTFDEWDLGSLFMGCVSRGNRAKWVTGALLILVMQGGFGWCQMHPRPRPTSGAGSVLLIARVESLSVAAAWATASPVRLDGQPSAVSAEVAVTTQWAVPANYTTFRLLGYIGKAGPFGAGVQADRSEIAGNETGSSDSGETLLVVDSGETNAARTRTDDIALRDVEQGRDERSTDTEEGRLTIVIQAL